MATNDFLPFGGAAGANVMTQANYAVLASRTAGFSSGTAQSPQLNKVWRQSSIIASVIGQLINDLTGQDAIDDGSTATLLANLKASIRAQSIGIVGAMRNARMNITTAAATGTFTADEIIVESALGGLTYRLANFNKTLNLAITGAGGMDTGVAPASGFVSIYAIYNPTTQASALLACDQAVSSSSTYTGANMPSGYTASALVSAWGTNASRLLVLGAQVDRSIDVALATILNTTAIFTNAPTNMNSIVPIAAVAFSGLLQCGAASSNVNSTVGVSSTSSGIGLRSCGGTSAVAGAVTQCSFSDVAIVTSRTIYFTSTVGSGSLGQAAAYLTSYKI